MMAREPKNASNTLARGPLMEFVERIEAAEARKRDISDQIGVMMAEAKAKGFLPAGIRAVIKGRRMKPSAFREAEDIRDLYFSAAGLGDEPPLFKYLDGLARDVIGKDELIKRLKELVPPGAGFTVDFVDPPIRVWRNQDGTAHAEQVIKAEPTAGSPSSGAIPGEPTPEPPPDVDEEGAAELGRQAARDNKPIIDNPFPFGDKRRARWDEAWRLETGGDGMGPGEED